MTKIKILISSSCRPILIKKLLVGMRLCKDLKLLCTFRSIIFFKSGFLSQNIRQSAIFNPLVPKGSPFDE